MVGGLLARVNIAETPRTQVRTSLVSLHQHILLRSGAGMRPAARHDLLPDIVWLPAEVEAFVEFGFARFGGDGRECS
jgi:hypothetical protein